MNERITEFGLELRGCSSIRETYRWKTPLVQPAFSLLDVGQPLLLLVVPFAVLECAPSLPPVKPSSTPTGSYPGRRAHAITRTPLHTLLPKEQLQDVEVRTGCLEAKAQSLGSLPPSSISIGVHSPPCRHKPREGILPHE